MGGGKRVSGFKKQTKKEEKVRRGEGLMFSEKEIIKKNKKWRNGRKVVVFEINFLCLKLTKESGMEK